MLRVDAEWKFAAAAGEASSHEDTDRVAHAAGNAEGDRLGWLLRQASRLERPRGDVLEAHIAEERAGIDRLVEPQLKADVRAIGTGGNARFQTERAGFEFELAGSDQGAAGQTFEIRRRYEFESAARRKRLAETVFKAVGDGPEPLSGHRGLEDEWWLLEATTRLAAEGECIVKNEREAVRPVRIMGRECRQHAQTRTTSPRQVVMDPDDPQNVDSDNDSLETPGPSQDPVHGSTP